MVWREKRGGRLYPTFGGLSVYDGARFRNYTTQNGLIVDLVNDVVEVGDDSLLVAVNTCGLNVLVRGEMKKSSINGKGCPVINQFLKSKDGNTYASADDGLYKIEQTSFKKLSAYFPLQKEPIIFLGAIVEYKDFIVFTRNDLRNYMGLFLYSKRADKITDALLKLPIQGLKTDHTGIIWISTSNAMQNLDTIALAAGKLELRKPYAAFVSGENPAAGNLNFNLNEPMVASGNKGIIRYNLDGTSLLIDPPEHSTWFQNFFIDREDILWICNDGNGVYKLPNTRLQSTERFSTGAKSVIMFVKAFSRDSVWMVMNNGQWVLHTPAEAKHFNIIPALNVIPLQYNSTTLYALGVSHLNTLYMAPLPKGTEKIIRFKKILTLPDSSHFGGESINDPYGNLILFEPAVFVFSRNDNQNSFLSIFQLFTI